MASLNKVMVIGNLGRDPEVRYTQSGDAVANFSLAATETWKDKGGTKQERTEWVRCTAFGRTGEIAGEYLKTGSQCYVEGRMQTRKWTDKEGVERYTTEVVVDKLVLLGGKRDSDGGERPKRQASKNADRDTTDNFDDDIPF